MTDWVKVRVAWERDERKGFTWLIKELDLSVSPQAIRKHANKEEWTKQVTEEEPVTKKGNRGTQNSNRNREPYPNLPVAQEKAHLTEREKMFVNEYLTDFNATRAAIAAGYAKKCAKNTGYKVLQRPDVQALVRDMIDQRSAALQLDGEALMKTWVEIVNFDANELMQIRRIPCPFCYSTDGLPQYTEARYMKEFTAFKRGLNNALASGALPKKDEDGEVQPLPSFPGTDELEFVDESKEPNPDCPVCHGRGHAQTFIPDTRTLSPIAKKLYGGFQEINGDVQVVAASKEKAMESLAKALGLYREQEKETAVVQVNADDLFNAYETRMAKARERQAQVLHERGLDDEIEDLKVME